MKDKALEQALACLSRDRRAQLLACSACENAYELRLRVGQPPAVRTLTGERPLALPAVTADELRDLLARAAHFSVHSYTDSLRHGFVTLAGGHRLGLCGTVALENGQSMGVRTLSSVNVRIAREVGTLVSMAARWCKGELRSTLLLSPPGLGKTTLLRAWIAALAGRGLTVGVVDERGELAALHEGVPQYGLGGAVDVLEGCPKQAGVLQLLKTMSPRVIALDEITAPGDVEACALCAHCGVVVVATAHADDPQAFARRPLYRRLLALGLFEQAVWITCEDGVRRYRRHPLEGVGG